MAIIVTPARLLTTVLLIFWIAVCSPPQICAAQQQPIHVDVKLVNIAFSARDGRGNLVDDLAQNEVEILEDGVPQKISFFARSADVPLTLGLIVDASGSQEHFIKKHQHDLEVFLKDVLGPKDRVFLIGFANHIRLVSDFSQSGSALIESMKQYDHDSGKFPELGPHEDRDLGTAFYDAIYYSCKEKLANENGRRALLVFSDGEDNSSSHDMMSTIEAAQSTNVLVFAIRYTQKEHGKLTPRNRYGIRVMDRIAKETGGEHIDADAIDPHTYFRQIAEELRTSYELAYYPSVGNKNDGFRKVLVRTTRPGVSTRAKTGYFPNPPSAALTDDR